MASSSRVPPSENINEDHEYDLSTVPVGFRFRPTDEELITNFLFVKICGGKIHPGLIRDIDLYQYEPLDLKELAFPLGGDNMFFFTPLYKMSEKGKTRAKRETAHGTWRATQNSSPIQKNNEETIIGTRTALVYYEGKKDTKKTKTQWLMHEYRLSEENKPPGLVQDPKKLERWVLCVVYEFHRTKKSDGGNSDGNNSQGGMAKMATAGSSLEGGSASYSHSDLCPNPNSNPNMNSSNSHYLIPCEATYNSLSGHPLPNPRLSSSSYPNFYNNMDPTMHISNCYPSPNANQDQNSIPFRASLDFEQGTYLADVQNSYCSLHDPISHGSNIISSVFNSYQPLRTTLGPTSDSYLNFVDDGSLGTNFGLGTIQNTNGCSIPPQNWTMDYIDPYVNGPYFTSNQTIPMPISSFNPDDNLFSTHYPDPTVLVSNPGFEFEIEIDNEPSMNHIPPMIQPSLSDPCLNTNPFINPIVDTNSDPLRMQVNGQESINQSN